MQTKATTFSGRPAHTVRLAVAGLTTAALAVGSAALAPAAVAGGDRHDDAPEVVLALTDDTADALTSGGNRLRALGAADKDTHDGDVYLSFPVRGSDHDRYRRGGDNRDDRDDVAALRGALAVTGAGPDATWSALRVDLDKGVISARVDRGARAAVLRVDRDDHDGHYRRGGSSSVELTRAGARSLNAALPGSPFAAGDTFAGDSDGC